MLGVLSIVIFLQVFWCCNGKKMASHRHFLDVDGQKKIRPLLLKYQDKDGGPVARRF